MVKEKEQKDSKIELLENKMGLPDSKDFEEMNKLGLKKRHPEGKVVGLWVE